MNSVHSLLDNAAILVAYTIIYQVSVHYKETLIAHQNSSMHFCLV